MIAPKARFSRPMPQTFAVNSLVRGLRTQWCVRCSPPGCSSNRVGVCCCRWLLNVGRENVQQKTVAPHIDPIAWASRRRTRHATLLPQFPKGRSRRVIYGRVRGNTTTAVSTSGSIDGTGAGESAPAGAAEEETDAAGAEEALGLDSGWRVPVAPTRSGRRGRPLYAFGSVNLFGCLHPWTLQ